MRQFNLEPEKDLFSAGNPVNKGKNQEQASKLLDGLNDNQREAAAATEGPLMIIAGAGSGKTRTVTYRIAHLLETNLAKPWQILALTFTNKAAKEMVERIQTLVGEQAAKGLWMGTFHSVFARILRREAGQLGYESNFSIYDTDDSERIIRKLMKAYNLDTDSYTPRTIRNLISSAKNQLVGPAEYQKLAYTAATIAAGKIYGPYLKELRKNNAMDFDDLLLKPIELFQRFPDTLKQFQERWKYIHVDEYQDTNQAQYQLCKLLAGRRKNICVVGDDAQSIYAFRGADIQNILNFERDYPEAKTVRLEQNYRSTKRILQLADSVIRHNSNQLEKELWTDNEEGELIKLFVASSEKEEAQMAQRSFRDLRVRIGLKWKDCAVLYRTNAQSRALEDAFRRADIPYQIIGGINFYQRKEIKDALAYLKILVNPRDNESLNRIINYPARGIGKTTLEKVSVYAQSNALSMWEAVEKIEYVGLTARATNSIIKFRDMILGFKKHINTAKADELALEVIQKSGILTKLREENTVESLAKWENVQELINAVADYMSDNEDAKLGGFLQEVTLVSAVDRWEDQDDRVTLMTLHGSKGLEFPAVFMAGLEEGLFPLAMAAQDREQLEEERRLFYVGVTRAEKFLFLARASSRMRFGKTDSMLPSRFLEEMDQDVIRKDGARRMTKHRKDVRSNFSNTNASTGWSKPRASRPKPQPVYKAPEGRHIVYDEAETGEIAAGMMVEHARFGVGKVLATEGHGERMKATVHFSSIGTKKLVLRLAKLRRIG